MGMMEMMEMNTSGSTSVIPHISNHLPIPDFRADSAEALDVSSVYPGTSLAVRGLEGI